ncbi:dynamin family protein [Limnoraphis robusta]|uniref:Dynamin family protein n=1 Tax=Limnoraphis robusta CCNP1315 TaxID=3110306 RepID=A0ABU5U4Q8_9CYAN|nr:dynamin family protein [Limnoraphis robusta]MEA5497958.1 dynamin family protein [Limnoraphis robusta BA-68 BA1]MEA5522109.1 dynamin family protein [Limnoraphis robusta CCNP1315]MEA5544187.1 dynamin family protein [Limnoraphis robusta CCNP1324]
MTSKNHPDSFINDLEKVASVRQGFANYLGNMAEIISKGDRTTFAREIKDLQLTTQNLREGVFRLLVLGDMKRGKSTFLNALLGENVLPSDVNPCTAVLTILRFNHQKQVTVYFNDGKSPEVLDFDTFKIRYTIDPKESKRLEDENKQAFPDVEYAVVEYPLALLEKGVEVVDSPGLNDTEARNQLTLGYLNNCHAVLFVMSATQQFTLGERRYLENYIKERGLTVFFLINAWDLIRETVIVPDEAEIEKEENKVREFYRNNLWEYCQVDDNNIYSERVFEISARNALRRRLRDSSDTLEGTGFPEFIDSLNTFLTKERAISELRQARSLARQTHRRVHQSIESRIPLLNQDVDELKHKIRSVQPEFDKLTEIRDNFKDDIRRMRDHKTDAIVNNFRFYVSNLGTTFESDFGRYQPQLKFLDFLRQGKRKKFEASLKQAFELYLNDKIADWSRNAEREMDVAFKQLALSALRYGQSYSETTDKIAQKLTGKSLVVDAALIEEDKSPGWAKWAAGIFAAATGDIAGVAMAGTGLFNWKQILLNLGGVALVGGAVYAITGVLLGPLGIALAGLGLGTLSANQARGKMIKVMKTELVKYLPQIASEQSEVIRKVVQDCFDAYGNEVISRMNDDIQSRKSELDDLVKQKERSQSDRDIEVQRLRSLDNQVLSLLHQLEDTYDSLIEQKS